MAAAISWNTIVMNTLSSSSSGSIDPLHIGETAKEIWNKPLPNAILWPFKLIWKNAKPGVSNVLRMGKNTVIEGIRVTREKIQTLLMNAPIALMPEGKRPHSIASTMHDLKELKKDIIHFNTSTKSDQNQTLAT